MDFASCTSYGTQYFEMAPRFLENFWTCDDITFLSICLHVIAKENS
jgi:hypothetical protein